MTLYKEKEKKRGTTPKPKTRVELDTTTILGIDYSYEECGFAIYSNGQILELDCLNFKAIEEQFNVKLDHQDRRAFLAAKIQKYHEEFHLTSIILERIRQFSQGHINIHSIIAFAELIVTVIDAFPKPHDVPVYSVEVRSWKNRILGSANADKADAVKWAKEKLTIELMTKRRWKEITHNEADALGLSHFGVHPEAPLFLIRER